jgi:hypothetical protein
MSPRRLPPVLTTLAVLVLTGTDCGAVEKAAAKDPLKCERDPNCAKNERAMDCSAQCVDDRACVERCQQVQAPNGPLGH